MDKIKAVKKNETFDIEADEKKAKRKTRRYYRKCLKILKESGESFEIPAPKADAILAKHGLLPLK